MSKFRQSGLTLIEMLVAMTISLVVALAMVGVMANALGRGTTTIEMSRLTAELRTALLLMTRDVRRANYHGNSFECFGNVSCRTDGSLENNAQNVIKTILPVITADGPCFYYWLDRDSNGTVHNDSLAGFRRRVVNGVGTIQMYTPPLGIALSSTPDCTVAPDNQYWPAITDPNIVDVTGFVVDTALSYTNVIEDGATQGIDKIRIRITGVLVRDNTIDRTVEDTIRVRNDIYTPAP